MKKYFNIKNLRSSYLPLLFISHGGSCVHMQPLNIKLKVKLKLSCLKLLNRFKIQITWGHETTTCL
jgi:hypothetical protein